MFCNICLESYNIVNRIPRNLSCGHSFCDKCLKKVSNGYEIECPKCRQKSKNNLPICYAIYDHLLLESNADIDESCKIHEYEKLQFYCNKDKIFICAFCLSSLHQGHFVSSVKDKIIADENVTIMNKWSSYFFTKKEEYNLKKDRLNKVLKELDSQKIKLGKELNQNYDKMIENFSKSKSEMLKEIEELYQLESGFLKETKQKIENTISKLNRYKTRVEDINDSFGTMSNQNILSLNMEEFSKEENEINTMIENLISEKTQIKFKDIKWNEDIIFNRRDILLEEFIKEETKLKDHIVFFGDCKDKIILTYDLDNKNWNKIETALSGEYEYLDYSSTCQFKTDTILITGGCIYSNYKTTASKNSYIAKFVTKDQISFCEFKPMISERFSHGMSIIKGVPYVYGGHNGTTTLNSTEYFDEKENCWKINQSNMNIEREIFAHCVVKDRYIYIFGGFNDTHLDSIEKFDTLQNKWRLLNVKMKKAFQNSTAVCISEDQIVLIGGYNGLMHKSIDILNLTNLQWTSVDKLKIPRRRAHCYKYNDKILIFGGEGTDVDHHIPETFDLKTLMTSNMDMQDMIISKSMNFWCSSIIK